MARPIKRGSTDQTVYIKIIDSTTGAPETGVVSDTSGIDLWYMRYGADHVAITEATLSAADFATQAHSDGGIRHVSDGIYRLDLPDAAVAAAAGVDSVTVGGTITGMIVVGDEYPLVASDPYTDLIGTPVALDSGTATIAGMLTKMADDNGGADFDAGTDSLQELKDSLATASDIVDEFETQSQASATGFQVNVKEVNGTAQTANDNGADINAILADTGTDGVVVAAASVSAIAAAGYMIFEKNVAVTKFPIFMTDSTNHAPATGATVTVQLSADGAAFGNATDATAAEIGSGWYECDFTQAEMNYNFIIVKATATGCDQFNAVIRTQS